MRFLDNNIKIIINPKAGSNLEPIIFKAYLEKSDIQYAIKEVGLDYAPVSYGNASTATKVLQSLDLVFNVFSEHRNETIENYIKLHRLIDNIKPVYVGRGAAKVRDSANTFGLISIIFKGLPVINADGKDELRIAVKNFNYSINQEMGFIELPYDSPNKFNDSLYVSGKMRLVPIAFKISIGGQIVLDRKSMVRELPASGGPAAGASAAGTPAAPAASIDDSFLGGDASYQAKIKNAASKILGKSPNDLDAETYKKVLLEVKKGFDGVINSDGTIAAFPVFDDVDPTKPTAYNYITNQPYDLTNQKTREILAKTHSTRVANIKKLAGIK